MGSGATEITVGGQVVIVQGEQAEIDAVCQQRKLTQDDGLRRLRTIDGEAVTVNIGAVALIRAAATRQNRGAFGFARALGEEG